MKVHEVIQEIIELPIKFNEIGTVSMHDLLEKTGYFEFSDKITMLDILRALNSKPKYVSYWLSYSEDKRTSPGWFFRKKGKDKYFVGRINNKGHKKLQNVFDNVVEACAFFIKKEIDDIASYCIGSKSGLNRLKKNNSLKTRNTPTNGT